LLPIESWSIRHQSAGALYFTAIVPAADADIIQAVSDRIAGNLILSFANRAGDGSATFTNVVDVALSEFRYDIGPQFASLTVISRVTRTNSSPMTRDIRGVVYRSLANGTRRVRCGSIDHAIQPGDTADLGNGETFVIGSLSASASPGQTVMEIAEAGD
jgi:hypothetical protein